MSKLLLDQNGAVTMEKARDHDEAKKAQASALAKPTQASRFGKLKLAKLRMMTKNFFFGVSYTVMKTAMNLSFMVLVFYTVDRVFGLGVSPSMNINGGSPSVITVRFW